MASVSAPRHRVHHRVSLWFLFVCRACQACNSCMHICMALSERTSAQRCVVDAGLAARLDARRCVPRACLLPVPHAYACVALTHVADQPSGAAHRPIVPQPDQVKSSQVKVTINSNQVQSSQIQPTPRPLLRLHGHLSTATSTIHWQHGHPFPRGEGATAAAVITAASSPRCYFPRPAPIRASICATSARPLSASLRASLLQPPRHLRAISASCRVSPQGASRHSESSPSSLRLTRPRCRPRSTPPCALPSPRPLAAHGYGWC